jgi:hypothetical protein
MQPFDEVKLAQASHADQPHMRAFNKQLSSICITSEYAFGLLKARFTSLKEMGKHEDIQDEFKEIEAMMIIHNICIDWKDRPDDIWDWDPTDDWSDEEEVDADIGLEVIGGKAHVPAHETNAWLKDMGRQKRRVVLDELFPI